jgi:hypothetical protein
MLDASAYEDYTPSRPFGFAKAGRFFFFFFFFFFTLQ